jgi:two-component system, OmpR family, response regulator
MRLLLIEDDQMLARAIAAALLQSRYAVNVAATASHALQLARNSDFNIAILDLGLPDRDGIELLHDIRRDGFALPILILSARDGLNDRIRGLDAGANDYLVKPFALGELEARLRALLRRGNEHASLRELGRLRFDVAAKQAQVGGEPIDLTARECAILEILTRSNKIVSKQALFDAIFPVETEAGPNALEVHISRLRHKLKHAGLTLRNVRGLGYRIEDWPPHGGSKP